MAEMFVASRFRRELKMTVAELSRVNMQMLSDHLCDLSDEPNGYPGMRIRRHIPAQKQVEGSACRRLILIWVAGVPAPAQSRIEPDRANSKHP